MIKTLVLIMGALFAKTADVTQAMGYGVVQQPKSGRVIDKLGDRRIRTKTGAGDDDSIRDFHGDSRQGIRDSVDN